MKPGETENGWCERTGEEGRRERRGIVRACGQEVTQSSVERQKVLRSCEDDSAISPACRGPLEVMPDSACCLVIPARLLFNACISAYQHNGEK